MEQTAVEYLIDQLFPKVLTAEQYYHINQAKEIEKKQQGYSEEDLKKAFNTGFSTGYNDETSPSYLTSEKWISELKKINNI